MRQIMREHCRACRRVFAFIITYARLSGGERAYGDDNPEHLLLLMECPPSCPGVKPPTSAESQHPCRHQCEVKRLFLEGWQQGEAQARQAYEMGDLAIIEDIGRAAGLTSRRPPRNYRRYYAEQDAVDANLHSEALRRFISVWRETGGDRRQKKGV
jgi:hypothetical protein